MRPWRPEIFTYTIQCCYDNSVVQAIEHLALVHPQSNQVDLQVAFVIRLNTSSTPCQHTFASAIATTTVCFPLHFRRTKSGSLTASITNIAEEASVNLPLHRWVFFDLLVRILQMSRACQLSYMPWCQLSDMPWCRFAFYNWFYAYLSHIDWQLILSHQCRLKQIKVAHLHSH